MVKTQSQAAFTQTTTGFDAVLGARGSKLQLVLNAIFHLEASPGNMAAADYEMIRRHPAVKTAIPLAVGDNLRATASSARRRSCSRRGVCAGEKATPGGGRPKCSQPANTRRWRAAFAAQRLG
jgi:hypothetical protein